MLEVAAALTRRSRRSVSVLLLPAPIVSQLNPTKSLSSRPLKRLPPPIFSASLLLLLLLFLLREGKARGLGEFHHDAQNNALSAFKMHRQAQAVLAVSFAWVSDRDEREGAPGLDPNDVHEQPLQVTVLFSNYTDDDAPCGRQNPSRLLRLVFSLSVPLPARVASSHGQPHGPRCSDIGLSCARPTTATQAKAQAVL
eukprot:1027728-Rhodomonas_salina.1